MCSTSAAAAPKAHQVEAVSRCGIATFCTPPVVEPRASRSPDSLSATEYLDTAVVERALEPPGAVLYQRDPPGRGGWNLFSLSAVWKSVLKLSSMSCGSPWRAIRDLPSFP